MSNRYDVIVIGAGHNGLTAATLLAKRGRKVLVVEKRNVIGGLAASEEFHPGFRSSGVLNDTTGLRSWVVDQLELKKHGLKLRKEEAPIFAPQTNGRGLLLWRDARRAAEEIGPHSTKDAASYVKYRATIERIGPFMRRVFDEFPPDVMDMSFPGLWDLMKKAVSLRMLGKADMMEILRIGPMCVADWLNEWFDTDILKAALAGPSIYCSFTGPWSPGTNANLLLAETMWQPSVEGGPQALVKALESAAKAAGVEIRANTEVKRVNISKGKVKGITLVDGSEITADRIAASCNPKHLFLNLIDPALLTQNFEHNIKNVRTRGTTAKINLAVSAYPEFANRPSLRAEYIRTGEYFDQMERAFDAIKYRNFSPAPLLDIYVPTLEAPELAPKGQHVLSMLVHFAPHHLDGGWTEAKRAEMYEAAISALAKHAPDVRKLIVGKEVLTPVDLEKRFNLTGGQLFHGEHAADQLLVRPTPECARYATPFEGLYLAGSGSHPGGGITCAPGALATKVIGG